jgi:succinate dehydrogenase flavin-adding protein (antitoxin of CptAB toxin-antitoxin module)
MPNRVTPSMATLPMPDDREILETLRRRLGFRAWRRGTREADLPIGTLAYRCLTEPQE